MLRIDDLTVRYGAIEALSGVSLRVDHGEVVTLIGANGAGKSTLLMTISGLLRGERGSIRFAGADITRAVPHRIVRMGIAHVPEGRRVFADLSVEENLELGAYARPPDRQVRQDRDHVYALFPQLAKRRRQRAGTLSGGEQQMLAIGRGLMARPRLLLLDEPSLGLAPVLVTEIFKALQEINREGATILLVEQNAHMALRIAARGYVLESGRVTLSGAAHELEGNPGVREAYLGE
ncbi:MAG: ABC transporter ATP-binding protein [Armatimonadota bacterium]|nr:MAG: ABC transporter ATP-binding protein [Armatimonadota bacterium]